MQVYRALVLMWRILRFEVSLFFKKINHSKPSCALLCLPLLMLFSCTPEFLNEEELKSFVRDEENGLIKSRKLNGYEIQVSYRSTDLIIAQETGGETSVSKEELDRLTNKYADYYYFTLSLSKNNKEALYQSASGQGQFSDLLQTLSFRMANHVNMTTAERDTIYVADYAFPRIFGMGSSTNLMFVFDKNKVEEDEWIQFNLKEFGLGVGNQNFRFRKKDLDNVPKIDFQEIQ